VKLTVCQSVCLLIYLSIRLFSCLSICLSTCLSVYPFVYLSVCSSVCLSVCLPVCLSIRMSSCLSACSNCLIRISYIYIVYLSFWSTTYLPVYLFNCLDMSVCLLNSLFICLSFHKLLDTLPVLTNKFSI